MKKTIIFLYSFVLLFSLSIFVQGAPSNILIDENDSGVTVSINIGSSYPGAYTGGTNYDYGYNIISTLEGGYFFRFTETLGMTIVGEIGYNASMYGDTQPVSFIEETYSSTRIHSIVLGVIPKFNFYRFSIGLGAGVKLPFYGITYSGNVINGDFSFTGNALNDIDVTPYLKIALDYSLYITDVISIVLGVNMGYDFSVGNECYKASPEALNLGFQVGVKFG